MKDIHYEIYLLFTISEREFEMGDNLKTSRHVKERFKIVKLEHIKGSTYSIHLDNGHILDIHDVRRAFKRPLVDNNEDK